MSKSSKIVLVSGIGLIMIIVLLIILFLNCNKIKISKNLIVENQKYQINKNTLNLAFEIKNTSKNEQSIDSIVLRILDDKNEEVVYLLKRIGQNVKPKNTIRIEETLNISYSNLDKNEKITINYELQNSEEEYEK